MSKINRQLKRYFRNVKYGIPSTYPHKAQVIHSIKSNVYSYCADHPDASMDDIIENFGSSSEIICSFIDELDAATIAHTLKKRKLIITICFATFLLVVAGLSYYIHLLHTHLPVTIEDTIYIYESTELTSEY